MNTRNFAAWIRRTRLVLLLICGVILVGASQLTAQTPKNHPKHKTANATSAAGITVPEGCKPGQLRCMNNKHRLAAAAGNADRRAKAMKATQTQQGEVK